MKKFISLILIIALIIPYQVVSYASEISSPSPVSLISKPVGGLSSSPVIPEKTDSVINLDEVLYTTDYEEFFYNALYEQQPTITLYSYGIPASNFTEVYLKFAFEHPELFLVDSGFTYIISGNYVYSVSPSYYVDKSNRENFYTAMNKKLDEYYELVKDIDDDLKKYLLIHSKMIRETHYDYTYSTNPAAHTVYSFFVNGGTTCQGYANALKLIGDKVGLEVDYCYNRERSVGHIWNYIKINGKWYHTDVTWDDYSNPLGDGAYNNENDQGGIHLYFLCSDDAYALNGHGYKFNYKTFGNTLLSCTDKNYEDDRWAFNLTQNGSSYLTDFDYEDGNLYFDLVGATDGNSNPLKFVTNNLWDAQSYIALPVMYSDYAYYYVFARKALPASKIRLIMRNEDKIKWVKTYSIQEKTEFVVCPIKVPLDAEKLTQSDSITMHLWSEMMPLAEKNTVMTKTFTDKNLPEGGEILPSSIR